jgi:hypothetical protein
MPQTGRAAKGKLGAECSEFVRWTEAASRGSCMYFHHKFCGASASASPPGMTYLDVRLRAGDRWLFQPPENHDVAWIACHQGLVLTPEEIFAGEAAVFEQGNAPIQFTAPVDTAFVLGSAVKHPFDLVTGNYSVHTSADALRRGESNIATIGRRLHNQGVLGRRAATVPADDRRVEY